MAGVELRRELRVETNAICHMLLFAYFKSISCTATMPMARAANGDRIRIDLSPARRFEGRDRALAQKVEELYSNFRLARSVPDCVRLDVTVFKKSVISVRTQSTMKHTFGLIIYAV